MFARPQKASVEKTTSPAVQSASFGTRMKTFARVLVTTGVLVVLSATSVFLQTPENQEHGFPQHAVEIARPFGFPVTNSMVVTWVVAAGLILFARLATRNMKQVPDVSSDVIASDAH